jgi:hypothetical protein
VHESKRAFRQLTKTRAALQSATSQLLDYADENQELRYRIRTNALRYAHGSSSELGIPSPHQSDQSFIEGAVWMGNGALRSLTALQRSIEARTAEFLNQARRPSPNTVVNRDTIRVRFVDDLESKLQFCKNAVEQALEHAAFCRHSLRTSSPNVVNPHPELNTKSADDEVNKPSDNFIPKEDKLYDPLRSS